MNVGRLGGDEVAQSLARKAFARHVMWLELGPIDAQAKESIREALVQFWEEAGSPPGAFSQAAMLGAELPRLIAEDDDVALEHEGVSRAQQIACAEDSSAFLTSLATEIDGQ